MKKFLMLSVIIICFLLSGCVQKEYTGLFQIGHYVWEDKDNPILLCNDVLLEKIIIEIAEYDGELNDLTFESHPESVPYRRSVMSNLIQHKVSQDIYKINILFKTTNSDEATHQEVYYCETFTGNEIYGIQIDISNYSLSNLDYIFKFQFHNNGSTYIDWIGIWLVYAIKDGKHLDLRENNDASNIKNRGMIYAYYE